MVRERMFELLKDNVQSRALEVPGGGSPESGFTEELIFKVLIVFFQPICSFLAHGNLLKGCFAHSCRFMVSYWLGGGAAVEVFLRGFADRVIAVGLADGVTQRQHAAGEKGGKRGQPGGKRESLGGKGGGRGEA